jgi:hypothetical protein
VLPGKVRLTENAVKSILETGDRRVYVILSLANHKFADARESLSAYWTKGRARRYHRARRLLDAVNRAAQ